MKRVRIAELKARLSDTYAQCGFYAITAWTPQLRGQNGQMQKREQHLLHARQRRREQCALGSTPASRAARSLAQAAPHPQRRSTPPATDSHFLTAVDRRLTGSLNELAEGCWAAVERGTGGDGRQPVTHTPAGGDEVHQFHQPKCPVGESRSQWTPDWW